jgi:SAM-dependent methyltransferase
MCLACGSGSFRPFFELRGVPTEEGALWPTAEQARAATVGDIELCLCAECGYIGNVRYDPSRVRFVGHRISLDHSPSFQRFLDRLCERLVETYSVRGRTVIDIGCGTGRFLRTLCRLGDNRGIGFDPSWSGEAHEAVGRGIDFIADIYSERYVHLKGDLISFRHVLDLLDRPDLLLGLVRRLIGADRDSVVYCEVPNALRTFDDVIVWNVIYEHRSWFTAASLANLFERSGYEIIAVAPCWQDEYLGIEVRAGAPRPRTLHETELERIAASAARFGSAYASVVDRWRTRLDEVERSGRHVAVWGAGARAIAFFALCPDAARLVPTVVDINPGRQSLYLPRTAHRVEAPERLVELDPDIVLITNPAYEREIVEQARALDLHCEFWTL